MGYQLIAIGDVTNLNSLGEYENHFEEGSKGVVELDLRLKAAADVVSLLDKTLEAGGVPESRVTVEGHFLRIWFKKEIAPLVLIAGAIAACAVLFGIVISWKLFKLTPFTVVGLSLGLCVAILAAIVVIAILGRLVLGGMKIGR